MKPWQKALIIAIIIAVIWEAVKILGRTQDAFADLLALPGKFIRAVIDAIKAMAQSMLRFLTFLLNPLAWWKFASEIMAGRNVTQAWSYALYSDNFNVEGDNISFTWFRR